MGHNILKNGIWGWKVETLFTIICSISLFKTLKIDNVLSQKDF